jgi:hypothetical protein
MKKLILALFALLVSSITMAQLKFGVKGGLNIATIRIKNGHAFDRIPGFYAGGLARLKVADEFGLQAELVYSRQGMKTQRKHKPMPRASLMKTGLAILMPLCWRNTWRSQASTFLQVRNSVSC